ncbi:MAG: tail fiber domain-containing protein [Ignavibacteriaceae bacterium]|jgi:hypothetical protein
MKTKLFNIFLFAFLSASIYGQDIILTLPQNGSVYVNDVNSNVFLSIDLARYLNVSKSITLPNTSDSTLGVIYKGGNRFIHDYTAPGKDGKNTFIGINSGNFTMGGGSGSYLASYNTGVGQSTLSSLTTGSNNAAFGNQALTKNTTGNNNNAFGIGSLRNNTTGEENSAFSSLPNNTTGYSNSGFGYGSLSSNTTGSGNSAFGHFALGNNITAGSNSAFGQLALSQSDANSNSAFGYRSLGSSTTGYSNAAFGDNSLFGNMSGNYNSAFGSSAGFDVTTGTNLTLVGYNAQPSSGSASNEITLGDNNITALRCAVQSISTLSDERDKRNIKDLKLGIGFLMKLKPRQFNWDKRDWYAKHVSDGTKMEQTPTAGFIAQELDKVQLSENAEWLHLVLKDNPERMEATAGNLLPIIVKAIQELKVENESIKTENVMLKERLIRYEKMQAVFFTELEKLKANTHESTKVSMGE